MKTEKCVAIENGYYCFSSPSLINEAVNGEKLDTPLHTDIMTHPREMMSLLDLPYGANDQGQAQILGMLAAMLYAKLQGSPVTPEIVRYSKQANRNVIEKSIAMLIGDTDVLKGCVNGTDSEVLVISIGGNRAAILIKKDGSETQPVLIPMPTFRVKCPESIVGNPFIRKLFEEEKVENILKKEKLPTNIMKRKEERRFHATVEDVLKYPLISKKLLTYIQVNKLYTCQMFRDIQVLLGGPLNKDELQKETEEIKVSSVTDEIRNWTDRLGIQKDISSLYGVFGTADAQFNGTTIFSTLLPLCYRNEHIAEEFFFAEKTDLLEPEALTICPVDHSVLPDDLSKATVTYEFSTAPDPVTCLVSYSCSGATVRKRYGVKEFVQLKLPVVIAPFKGGDSSVPLAVYTYLFDPSTDRQLKIRATRETIPSISVDMPAIK